MGVLAHFIKYINHVINLSLSINGLLTSATSNLETELPISKLGTSTLVSARVAYAPR